MHTKDFLAQEQRAAGLDAMADKAALALCKRQHNGEFDASVEESEEWANSPEGREAIAGLIAGR